MLMSFKPAFEHFLTERIIEVFKCLESKDKFYRHHVDIINNIVEQLKGLDLSTAKEFELTISYLKHSLSKTFYDIGFKDGQAFEKMSNPVVEIEE
jgi:hypothetical protein